MPNDFSQDTGCKALWRFESGALTVDSKGNNTLTASASPPTVDTVDFKEGAGCAVFAAANTQHYSITDANLDTGFPFKNGDTTKTGSFCFWYKPTTTASWRFLISKSNYPPGNAAFALIDNNGVLYIEYGQGAYNWNDTSTGITLASGHEYHITCTIDINGRVQIIVWDDTTSIAYSWLGWFNGAIAISYNPFVIGDRDGYNGNALDGRLDEIVVFNRVINVTDIYLIRTGQYAGMGPHYGANNYSGDDRFKTLWRFEPSALTVDSIGTNTLSLHSGATGPRSGPIAFIEEGDGCVELADGCLDIADANLDAGFPLKNGDAIQQITICNWITRDTAGNYNRSIWSKGTDIGFAYDDQNGSLLGLGAFRAFLRYKNTTYDLGFNFPASPIAIAGVVDGIAKTAHVRYYNPITGITINKELSFAQQLGTNTDAFRIGDTVPSWVGTIDGMVVAAAILTDDEIDQIFAGTFSPPSAPPDNCLSLTFCESIPAALAPCLSLTTCEDIPIVYPPDNCLSLTQCPGIEPPRLGICLSLTHCPELPKGAPASVITSTKCQDIPLASGRGTFLIFS
jgi:hypothetical protein